MILLDDYLLTNKMIWELKSKMKMKNYINGSLAGIALAITLSACVTQKYQTPNLPLADAYRGISSTDSTSIADLKPTVLFKDAALQALITEALSSNYDLKNAIQRMRVAQATLTQAKLAFLPTLSADLSVADNKQSTAALNFPAGVNINTETQLYKAQLTAAWEIDVWGKIGSAKRGALASYLQTEAAKRAIQTQLICNVANSYYMLLALDEQLRITEETLKIRSKSVETINALKEAGIVNGAAVVQSEANKYAAEVTIPDLKKSIRELENTISILIGKPGNTIARSKITEQEIYADLNTGVSSLLLKNRPDVQGAEYAFQVAFENTNLAKTYFYPSLTLTANGGLSSLKLENFFNNSIFYSIVGGLTQPILGRGQNKARLETARANQEIAYNDFQKTILTAGNEVSNALYAYQTVTEKEGSRAKQIASLTKAVDFTEELLKYSSATNYTDVLTSQQSLLSAQLSAVNDRLEKLQAVVNLYRALGGGWK
jgi:multidrug efflux system outer membrane protein